MAIRQSNDSLRRCDPNLYNGLYDVSKPKIALKETAKPTIHKDTLEISGDKLKKEALERLRHSSKYLILQTGFMRVGKYVFVGVAFLPYMLLYGLPKWVLVGAFPVISSIVVTLAEKIQKQAKKAMNVVKQRAVQVLYFMKLLATPLIQPLVKTWLAIQRNIKRLRYQAQITFNQAREKIGSFLRFPLVTLRQAGQRISKKLADGLTRIKNRMDSAFTSIKESPQNLMKWMSTQIRDAKEYLLRWPRKWKMNFQTTQRAANTATEWLAKRFQSLKNPFKTFIPGKNFYHETFKPHFDRVMTKWSNFLKKGRDHLDQRKKRILQFLKNAEEKVRSATLKHIYDGILSFISFLKLPLIWQKAIQQFLDFPVVRGISKGCLKAFSLGSLMILKLTSYAVKCFFSGGQYALVGLGGAVNYPMRALQIGMSYSGDVLGFAGKTCRKMIYLTLLMLVMVSITLLWGMRSAKKVLDMNFG